MFDNQELKRVEVRLNLKEAGKLYSTESIDSPESAMSVMADAMASLDREHVCVVNLDSYNRPINFNVVSIGGINEAPVPVANVFKQAILSNGASIILLHNHPSGIAEPSSEDWAITKRINEAGKLMGIPVVDHVIVGGGTGERYSLREERPDAFFVHDKSQGYSLRKDLSQGKKSLRERVKELTDKLETGIQTYFTSDKYREYLRTMSKFHNYSINNSLLIAMAKPDATHVASYDSWTKNFERHVKKGEHGIPILVPTPYRRRIEQQKVDVQGNPVFDTLGNPMTETVERLFPHYKIGYVFDVSQTEGKPLPELVSQLKGNVRNYDYLMKALKNVSPVPIEFEKINSGANGYYHSGDKRIAIKEGMSEEQTVKTTIHELTHTILHDKDFGTEKDVDKYLKEQQAESVAFCVSSYYGIDTSEYSFGYILGWAKDKGPKELKGCLQVIRDTSHELISNINTKLQELDKERIQDQKISFYVAECAEYHNLGEKTEDLSLPEAVEKFRELSERKSGMVPGLGIRWNDSSDPTYNGAEADLMIGKILDVETIHEISVFRDSQEVQEAVEEIKQAFPDVKVRGRAELLIRESGSEEIVQHRHR